MRTHLTIRDLPPEISRRLEEVRRRRGESLNRTVINLLAVATGATPGTSFDNGLGKLAGKWNQAELDEFAAATQVFESIDPELWS